MSRPCFLALFFFSTMAVASPTARGTGEATTYLGAEKGAPLEVTVTGDAARAIFQRLKDVKQTDDWEDGLVPMLYHERSGQNVACVGATVVGPAAKWDYTCRFSIDSLGNSEPGR